MFIDVSAVVPLLLEVNRLTVNVTHTYFSNIYTYICIYSIRKSLMNKVVCENADIVFGSNSAAYGPK